jgi:hypothetical protein
MAAAVANAVEQKQQEQEEQEHDVFGEAFELQQFLSGGACYSVGFKTQTTGDAMLVIEPVGTDEQNGKFAHAYDIRFSCVDHKKRTWRPIQTPTILTDAEFEDVLGRAQNVVTLHGYLVDDVKMASVIANFFMYIDQHYGIYKGLTRNAK